MISCRGLLKNLTVSQSSKLHSWLNYASFNFVILFHQLSWKRKLVTVKSLKANGDVRCVWVYMQKMELRYWWEYGDEKTRID